MRMAATVVAAANGMKGRCLMASQNPSALPEVLVIDDEQGTREQGGRLELASTVGVGTTVTVRLPRPPGEPPPPAEPEPLTPSNGGATS